MKRPKIFAVGLSLIYVFFYTPSIYATDIFLTCTENDCVWGDLNATLFQEHNVKPLDSFRSSVVIQNSGDEPLNITIKLIKHIPGNSQTIDLGEFTMLSIHDDKNVRILEPTSLRHLNESKVTLGTISANESKTFAFIANVADLGNEYQSTTTSFDVEFIIDATPVLSTQISNSADMARVLGITVLPATARGAWLVLFALLLIFIGLQIKKHLHDRSH